MADNKEYVVPQFPMRGGVDQSQHPVRSDPGTYRSLQNMHIKSDQRIVIRGGCTSYFYSSGGAAHGVLNTPITILDYAQSLGITAFSDYQYGNRKCTWFLLDNNLCMLSTGGWDQHLDTSYLLTNSTHWTEFGEYVIFADRTTVRSLAKWNGTLDAPEKLTGAPRASCLSTHYDRLLAAGNPDAPDEWYASNVGNPDDWESAADDADSIDAGGFTGILPGRRTIVSISPSHYDGFYIGAVNSLHQIRGRSPSEYQYRLISGGIGNIGHRTFISVGNDILGWNDIGCYSMIDTDRAGGIVSSLISKQIQDIFRTKVSRDPSQFFSVNDTSNGMYITFMPSRESSSITYALCYYYFSGQWTWWKFNRKIVSASMLKVNKSTQLIIGDNYRSVYYLVNGLRTDFVSSAIDVLIETQKIPISVTPLNGGNLKAVDIHIHPAMTKTFNVKLIVDAANNAMRSIHTTIPLNTNLASRPAMTSAAGGFTLNSTHVLGSDDDYDTISLNAGGFGRSAQLTIENTAANLGNLELLGVQMRVNPSGSTP